jgi:bacterioferritin
MATSPDVLQSLDRDLALEHGAIMQYVIHAVGLRDTPIADTVKRAAREEMWHLEWLVEAITERGGEPTLDRADIFISAANGESLRRDVATEEAALSHYAITLGLVGDSDPDLKALVERIVDDERHHKEMFGKLADRVERDGEHAYAATPAIQPSDFGVIGPAIASEYTGVLTYLWNKYGCGDCEQGEQYFDMAVEDMRHVGWVASYVAGMGAAQPPAVPSDKVHFIHSTGEAKAAAGTFEESAESFYAAKTPEAANPDLRSDMERAATQHAFHRRQLEHMG